MSDHLLDFMAKHEEAVEKFSGSELNRLKSAILSASNPRDKALLETTARV